MPIREADLGAQGALNPLDLSIGHARVRALVVAVFDDQPGLRRTAQMVNLFVDRLELDRCQEPIIRLRARRRVSIASVRASDAYRPRPPSRSRPASDGA